MRQCIIRGFSYCRMDSSMVHFLFKKLQASNPHFHKTVEWYVAVPPLMCILTHSLGLPTHSVESMLDAAYFVPFPATPYHLLFRSLKFCSCTASPPVSAFLEALKFTQGHPVQYTVYHLSSRPHTSNNASVPNRQLNCGPLQISLSSKDPRTQAHPHLVPYPCSLPQVNVVRSQCLHPASMDFSPSSQSSIPAVTATAEVPTKDDTPQGKPETELFAEARRHQGLASHPSGGYRVACRQV